VTERIKHYRILEMLGRGGMGVVYSARDERLDRTVAIKRISQSANDPKARERLWREARTAASVNHPNVCQIYEVDEVDGEIFIAMELLEGQPLSARIDAGVVPLGEAVRITLGVLAALDALHRRGIVHRDLKPSNVFLTPHGVKLLDFGLARPHAAPASASETPGDALAITAAGVLVGSPRYLAPELWSGEAARPASDLFALGAMLFEILTGKPAFGGATILEVCRAVLNEHPPALAGGTAAAAVDRVIHRALEKRPEDRYPDAATMARELSSAAEAATSTEAMRVRPMTRFVALPFRVLRPDAETDFLADSVADAITSSLSGLESLVVRSSAAAARFAGPQPNLKALATEAEVDVALIGTLLRAGDQVRVSAQLVETPAGTIAWSGNVQLPLQDIFQLQDQLSRQIVEALSIPLSTRDRRSLQHDIPASARAYEFYLRANQVGRDTDLLPIARDLYRSCLAEDERYAPAWAQLGRVYRVLAKWHSDQNVEENRRLAKEAFERALALNADLPIAHSLYTYFEIEELGRAPAAMVRLLERARTRPGEVDLFAGLVPACRFSGLLNASVEADRRARRLDPNIRTSVSYTYWALGDYARAERFPDDPDMRALALAMLGRTEESLALYREAYGGTQSPIIQALVDVTVAGINGDRERCRAAAQRVLDSTLRDSEAIYGACRALARVGETDLAIVSLRRVVEGGLYTHQGFAQDPWLEPIRDHTEFAAIVQLARERSRAAAEDYLRAGGQNVLGIPPS
jgi:serine/threonine protein kinase